MFEDKTLVCKECGQEFVFTAGEQEFYASKGLTNEPKRCKSCRRPGKVYVCADCGGEARVRFEPRDGRPVYCSACFAKRNAERNKAE